MLRDELIIEEITKSDVLNSAQLKLRKSLTTLEKLANMSILFKGFKDPFYKIGRIVYMSVDINYLERHNVKVGDNINNYNDIKYKLMIMESTNLQDFENEGIKGTLKINPSYKKSLLHKGKEIYHSTFLVPEENFNGHIKLKHDE